MGPAERTKEIRERRWTVAADTPEGRQYLRIRDGVRHEWTKTSYLGLRFHEQDAGTIAATLTSLPPGATAAFKLDTWAST